MECERIQMHSIASIAIGFRRKWFEPEKTIFDLKQCFDLGFFCFSPDVFDIQLSSFEARFFGEHFERLPTSTCQPTFFWHPAKPIAFLSLSLSPIAKGCCDLQLAAKCDTPFKIYKGCDCDFSSAFVRLQPMSWLALPFSLPFPGKRATLPMLSIHCWHAGASLVTFHYAVVTKWLPAFAIEVPLSFAQDAPSIPLPARTHEKEIRSTKTRQGARE